MQTFSASGFTWTGSRNLQEAIDYAKTEGMALVCGFCGPGNILWYIPSETWFGTLVYWMREEQPSA